jgi:hypothetical protein
MVQKYQAVQAVHPYRDDHLYHPYLLDPVDLVDLVVQGHHHNHPPLAFQDLLLDPEDQSWRHLLARKIQI